MEVGFHCKAPPKAVWRMRREGGGEQGGEWEVTIREGAPRSIDSSPLLWGRCSVLRRFLVNFSLLGFLES